MSNRGGGGGDGVRTWDTWTADRVASLQRRRLLRSLRPVTPHDHVASSGPSSGGGLGGGAGAGGGGGSPMDVLVAPETLRAWLADENDIGASSGRLDPSPTCSCSSSSDSDRWCRLTLFSSNDYLGLSSHPAVRAAAAAAAARWGAGPRSSALVAGYTHEHRALESGLAALKGTEECLLFPTGYAANSAVIPAMCDGPDCHIFSDALNHASIIDGCRLAARAGARVSAYRHNDIAHLESLIDASDATRKMIVTDSLFSMDGDYAPLRELAALKHRHPGVLLAGL